MEDKKAQPVKKLSLDEKKALGIVLTGNFLEYFDLMLFSHLAFVVAPYFMPKTDPLVAKMLTILTFCSSFVIRPLAAYFWGFVGDHLGRVLVLSYTTMIMAVTCAIIPNIPPYSQCGIYSTVLIIMCRVLQGFSSTGESKGAEVFVAEIVPHFPKVFMVSVLVPITCDLGGAFAALLGSLCLSISDDGWKLCFYIGATIALCASIARRKLRETREFLEHIQAPKKPISDVETFFERRNFYALIVLNMIGPTAFYFAYSYGSDLLKDKVGLAPNMILLSNSSLLMGEIIFLYTCALLACRYNAFRILKVRTFASFILIPLSFIMLSFQISHLTVYIAQLVALLSTASFDPATPIIIRSFHIRKRFSEYSKAWAFSKAIMYISSAYLTFYLDHLYGMWGVLGLLMFFSTCFCVALYTFVPKNEMHGKYAQYLAQQGAAQTTSTEETEQEVLSSKQHMQGKLKKWVKT